ncbi:uncharacterized protein LOC117733108 isoform X2 [Cyclopterus lumpus]|uniref:uncharacterized protein LOC117733108 isoform X2 n=1 Tax=Cyclopterus lumpus TaxID=8103 RepID=UPI0014872AB5|nr:uncharacterized protein LOC117733108 isoform X2 [Cyclopterus lumpus]
MELILLVLMSIFLVSGASRAVCPDSPIVAAEGSAVTLPCHLEPQVNVQSRTVDWRRLDSCVQVLPGRVLPGLVHGYRYRKQNLNDQRVEFRNRTTLHGDLSRGNLSLLISSVTPKDSGSYRCFVSKPDHVCCVNLTVEPRDQEDRTTRPGSSSAVAPVEEEPDAEDRDAAKNSTVWIVVVVVVVVALFVVALLLRNRKTIKKMFRWTRTRTPGVGMVTMTTRQTEAHGERPVEAGEPLVADENRSSG